VCAEGGCGGGGQEAAWQDSNSTGHSTKVSVVGTDKSGRRCHLLPVAGLLGAAGAHSIPCCKSLPQVLRATLELVELHDAGSAVKDPSALTVRLNAGRH
jgi:hypothetical protein